MALRPLHGKRRCGEVGLAVLWLALAARVGLAIADHEPMHDGHLPLACAALFLVSAALLNAPNQRARASTGRARARARHESGPGTEGKREAPRPADGVEDEREPGGEEPSRGST